MKLRPFISVFIITCLASAISCQSMPASRRVASAVQKSCNDSALWGRDGELWRSTGRLPDFSYAGYHAGEAAIPKNPADWDLKRDFNAVGDGIANDTAALKLAIQKIRSGVLFIPEGTYLIYERIYIKKSNFVIRGAGPGKTTLFFKRSLSDLYGNKKDGKGYSQWSFGPGLLNFSGPDPISSITFVGSITSENHRGDRLLTVSSTKGLRIGQWVQIVESDPLKGTPGAGTLVQFLLGDLMPPGSGQIGAAKIVRFISKVKSLSANQVELERTLPYDIRSEWSPELHVFKPSVTEVGIENLSIRFPWSSYPGHFKENGYNGVFFTNASQCWADNIEVINSDFGIGLIGSNFCTIRSPHLMVDKPRSVDAQSNGWNGHHGIEVNSGSENLVTEFQIDTRFVHDLTVGDYTSHAVFSQGRGLDLNMDHHRQSVYSNLFTEIDCGKCTRPFESSGTSAWGPHSGAYSTFWNVHGESKIDPPKANFGPLLNFVGISLTHVQPSSPYKWYFESEQMACPENIHAAMVSKRMKK